MPQRRTTLIKAVLSAHGMPDDQATERANNIAVFFCGYTPRADLERSVRLAVAQAAVTRAMAPAPWVPASARAALIARAVITCVDACGLGGDSA